MKIASVTITSSRAHIIEDAIRSVVDWVDFCLLVDLCITDNTVEVAQAIAGDKLRVVKYEGLDQTGAMRNAGNDQAALLGVTWSCTLDTDERIRVSPGVDLRATLEACDSSVVMVWDQTVTYPKERFFRLPAQVRWEGHCHERIPADTLGIGILSPADIRFSELPKSPEAQRAKLEWVESEMRKEILADPEDAHPWLLLADAVLGLGRPLEARILFQHVLQISRNPHTTQLAGKRIAQCGGAV
jgi:hypothetical protein